LVRFRCNIKPECEIISGCAFTPSGVTYFITQGKIRFEGNVIGFPGLTQAAVAALGDGEYIAGVSPTTNTCITLDTTADLWVADGAFRYNLKIVCRFTMLAGVVTASTNLENSFYEADPLRQGQWYLDRHQQNLDYWQGAGEAAFLNTASHDQTGSPVTGMISVKNRMLVTYSQSSQLWQTDVDPGGCLFIDRYDFGHRGPGRPSLFYNRPMILSQRGFRAFDLTGLQFQALDDVNTGEAVQYAGDFTLLSGTFWPWLGAFVGFVKLENASRWAEGDRLPADSIFRQPGPLYGFLILSFSKESGISAWSFNPVAGITDVDQLLAEDDRIWVVRGKTVGYFDAKATIFRDSTDPVGGKAYETVANWHFSAMGDIVKRKRMLFIDVNQTGSSQISYSTQPYADSLLDDGPIVAGVTFGMTRIPLVMTGYAFAARLLTYDEAGWELRSLSHEFIPCGR